MLNNSILSYNKIEEIEEQSPISLPTISSSHSGDNTNEENKKCYYSFYINSKYELEENKSYTRAYSSPFIFSNHSTNYKNSESDEKITNISLLKNSNINSNNLMEKKIKKQNYKTNKNQITNLQKYKNGIFNKQKQISKNNSRNKNLNAKKNSLKQIDTTVSNQTIKNETYKSRVEIDNKSQNYNIYINNNIFNCKINKIIKKNKSEIENKTKNKMNGKKIFNYNLKNDSSKKNYKKLSEDINNAIKNNLPLVKSNKSNNLNNKNKTSNTKNFFVNSIKQKNKNINIFRDNSKKQELILKDLKNIDNNTLNNYNSVKNSIKKNKIFIKLKFVNLHKIQKSNGLFHILKFLDHEDIINILKTKNKKLHLLINKSIFETYISKIRENLNKYKEFLEILKYTLVFVKIKNLLRIDITITIRFIDKNKKISIQSPKHFQLIYLYDFLKKEKNNNKLFDCYGFDLFPDYKEKGKNENKEFRGIYLSKQITMFSLDKNDDMIHIQPILPFKINDRGIFNLEIYSTNHGFVNPSNLKIKLKHKDLNKNINDLDKKGMNNVRINEFEYLCKYWKKEKSKTELMNKKEMKNLQLVKNIIKKWFQPYFLIKDLFYDNIGLSVYKFHLSPNICGLMINNNLNIRINIKENNDYIENEIKKNNLLFERRGLFEIRKDENIIFYLSMNESNF